MCDFGDLPTTGLRPDHHPAFSWSGWAPFHISTSISLSSSSPPLPSVLSIRLQSFSHPTSNQTQSACRPSAERTQVDLLPCLSYPAFHHGFLKPGVSTDKLKSDFHHKPCHTSPVSFPKTSKMLLHNCVFP